MTNSLLSISAQTLKQALTIRQRIDKLQSKFRQLIGPAPTKAGTGAARSMTPKGKRNIVNAQKRRWAKWHRDQRKPVKTVKGKSAAWTHSHRRNGNLVAA